MKQLLLIILLFTSLTASAITRYFLVSYAYSNGTGSVGVTSTTFPSKAAIANILRRNYSNPTLKVVVTNIMEFRTQADFTAFFSDKSYYDTVAIRSTASVATPSTAERTWYFKDLGI